MDQRQPARTARTSIAVHLVSVDASPPGLPQGVTSAVSVTYAFFGGPIEYYDGAQVFIVGAKKGQRYNLGHRIRGRKACHEVKRPSRKLPVQNVFVESFHG
jgi:hypothetical protein